eukprot:9502732-Pyramimonas_sp.AAC.1
MYFCGGVLWLLCYVILPSEPAVALQTVFNQCQAWWEDPSHGVSKSGCFSRLKLSMFTNPKAPRNDFPKLKGKAAEIKHLLPALAWVWRYWMDEDDASHRHIELGLRMSARIDAILSDN